MFGSKRLEFLYLMINTWRSPLNYLCIIIENNRISLTHLFFYQFREWKLPEPPYEVSIVGKAPRGRKLQPTENTCAA